MKRFLPIIAALAVSTPIFAQDPAPGTGAQRPAVASRGKITAGDTVSRIAAPYVFGAPPILDEILVKKGETLLQNQPVAVLHGRKKAEAALNSAKAALESAKSETAVKVQEARNSLSELAGTYAQNNEVLNEKSPPRSEREKIQYEQKAILRQMEQAREMVKLVEASAKNAVARAEASVEEAQAALDDFTVKTPIAGEVIEIHAKPGETVGGDGVCEIADTDRMYVEAEVYVSDINRVAIGDEAECSPEALPNEILKGKVIEISRYVKTNRLFSQDPSEYSDMKVINVKISLDDPAKVDKLIGSLVRVRIFVKK